jgi:hypothetical protein
MTEQSGSSGYFLEVPTRTIWPIKCCQLGGALGWGKVIAWNKYNSSTRNLGDLAT